MSRDNYPPPHTHPGRPASPYEWERALLSRGFSTGFRWGFVAGGVVALAIASAVNVFLLW